MPQPGAWGFQHQQQPLPPPMQQPFLANQGMVHHPMLGNNIFNNQPPPFLSNQANLITNQQNFPRFPPAPPSLPPQPTTGPNLFNLNLNRPPPPPPEVVPRPLIGNNGSSNNQGNFGNQLERRAGDWNCKRCQNHNFAWRTNCGKCSLEKKYNESASNTGNNNTNQLNTHFAVNEFPRQEQNRVLPKQNDNNQELSDQEQQFDVMFGAWEEGFESWKRENHSNPDQVCS